MFFEPAVIPVWAWRGLLLVLSEERLSEIRQREKELFVGTFVGTLCMGPFRGHLYGAT